MEEKLLYGILIIGGSGIVIGILLGVASKYLVVKEDPRIETIYKMLPHFNCGACGYPGCQGMATGLINSEAKMDQCKPSKPDQKDAIILKLKELGIDINE